MQSPSYYNVKQSRAVKGHMQDLLSQHHGSIMAFDEALINGDAVLASALWRNLFGAAWGQGMGGVKGDKAPSPENPLAAVDVNEVELSAEERIEKEASFAVNLEQLVLWFRKETSRLDELTDEAIIYAMGENEQGDGSAIAWTSPAPTDEAGKEAEPTEELGDLEKETEKGPDSAAEEQLNQPAVWS